MGQERPKILFVDDDRSMRNLFRHAMPDHGYDVILSEGGGQALEQLRQHYDSISAVVTDIRMPQGLNGVELVRAIKEAYPASRIPILALTGHPRYLKEIGAVTEFAEVMAKPITMEHLAQVIKKHISAQPVPA